MNTKLYTVFAFAIGAAIGSVVAWKVTKTKYEQIAKEEAESFREILSKKNEELKYEHVGEPIGTVENIEVNEDGVKASVNLNKPSLSEYIKQLNDAGYGVKTNYADISNDKKEEKGGGDDMPDMRPFVIPPEEFGELDDYDEISLIYYKDGVLTDDWGNVIEDVEDMVGLDSLSHFGEYEDDSVFVRNPAHKADYEILADERPFNNVKERPPHWVDD